MTDATTHAQAQAAAQYESICTMLDAIDVDYDGLRQLRNMKADHEADMRAETDPKPFNVAYPDEAAELADLEAAAGDCEDEDDARQRLDEDPLEVTVRSGWVSQGEEMEAAEFAILLCTGGPAVRIRGEFNHRGQPHRAWLEYQDWGTPWTIYHGATQSRLMAYAGHFFG